MIADSEWGVVCDLVRRWEEAYVRLPLTDPPDIFDCLGVAASPLVREVVEVLCMPGLPVGLTDEQAGYWCDNPRGPRQ